MKIRITSVTSVSDGAGGRYRHGQVVDVDDDLARSWIAAGHARPADETDDETQERKASAQHKRTATKRAPRTAKKPDTDDE
ncbi:hypothetical protein [Streptomyces sp. NPDC057325]|uniref:DUF7302 family protein n=1 Tax=unclassified Streptomyces TaxID=2593676 RepID=UPI0036406D28